LKFCFNLSNELIYQKVTIWIKGSQLTYQWLFEWYKQRGILAPNQKSITHWFLLDLYPHSYVNLGSSIGNWTVYLLFELPGFTSVLTVVINRFLVIRRTSRFLSYRKNNLKIYFFVSSQIIDRLDSRQNWTSCFNWPFSNSYVKTLRIIPDYWIKIVVSIIFLLRHGINPLSSYSNKFNT
jgi:hypothetical protein